MFTMSILVYFSVHFIKCPNAVLDPGTVVASLELDDPNRITQVWMKQLKQYRKLFQLTAMSAPKHFSLLLQAQVYQRGFPVMKGPSVKGEKLHQVTPARAQNGCITLSVWTVDVVMSFLYQDSHFQGVFPLAISAFFSCRMSSRPDHGFHFGGKFPFTWPLSWGVEGVNINSICHTISSHILFLSLLSNPYPYSDGN